MARPRALGPASTDGANLFLGLFYFWSVARWLAVANVLARNKRWKSFWIRRMFGGAHVFISRIFIASATRAIFISPRLVSVPHLP